MTELSEALEELKEILDEVRPLTEEREALTAQIQQMRKRIQQARKWKTRLTMARNEEAKQLGKLRAKYEKLECETKEEFERIIASLNYEQYEIYQRYNTTKPRQGEDKKLSLEKKNPDKKSQPKVTSNVLLSPKTGGKIREKLARTSAKRKESQATKPCRRVGIKNRLATVINILLKKNGPSCT